MPHPNTSYHSYIAISKTINGTILQTPAVQGQTVAPVEEQLPALQEEEAFPVSNGQFHELAAQLSTLHEQAQEFEHRLSVLTEMIRRIEHAQDDQVSSEEEDTYTPHDTNR